MIEPLLNILVIFMLMFVGYILCARDVFSNHTGDVFAKLVLTIALPSNMLVTITRNFTRAQFLELMSGMIIPLLSIVATFALSYLYALIFHVEEQRRGSFRTMFTCSNTMFIGLPINLAVFGEKAIPYVLLYYIVNTVFFWTIGNYEIVKDSPSYSNEVQVAFDPIATLKKVFSPALLGFIFGLFFVLIGFKVPDFALDFFSYLGDLTTPLSMFVIGIIIFYRGIKNLRFNKDIAGVMIGRYVVSPLLVALLGQVIHVPDLMLKVFILQASMPSQNSVPILVRRFGGDEEFAASSLGYSVLLYIAYIPILLWIIL
ncbi:AEC family transporter [Enterococcus nangangensis]